MPISVKTRLLKSNKLLVFLLDLKNTRIYCIKIRVFIPPVILEYKNRI